jgi:hypothetical protein
MVKIILEVNESLKWLLFTVQIPTERIVNFQSLEQNRGTTIWGRFGKPRCATKWQNLCL